MMTKSEIAFLAMIKNKLCPRCGVEGYSFTSESGCCRYCAYPHGYLDGDYKERYDMTMVKKQRSKLG